MKYPILYIYYLLDKDTWFVSQVGFGKNGTLYALEKGKVIITCEKIDPNLDHSWARTHYAGRENSVIYKKHFNVIPEPQDNRFVLIDAI